MPAPLPPAEVDVAEATLWGLTLNAAWEADLLGLALPLAVVPERAALALDLWRYRPAMPTVRVLGRDVGLAPVAQIALLPALSVALAAI